jgi:hypothetical protein
MKSAISPDIWETKRMLITKLYKDEEWPLKQVIKLVQTRDFQPSESQLRSRLKKWHITKPSRKKYDGSRRLSGAKKNSAPKRSSESQPPLPSTTTFHTTPTLRNKVRPRDHLFLSMKYPRLRPTDTSFPQVPSMRNNIIH